MSESNKILIEGVERDLVLSGRSETLLMATRNQVGRDVLAILRGLGFVPRSLIFDEMEMIKMGTPEKIMGRDWKVNYYDLDEPQDTNLYIVYTHLGGNVGFMELLRQIRRPQGEGYALFFR